MSATLLLSMPGSTLSFPVTLWASPRSLPKAAARVLRAFAASRGVSVKAIEWRDEAWTDMLRNKSQEGIEVVEETPADHPGSWTLESNFKIAPATDALVQQVRDRGGAIGWYRLLQWSSRNA